jgi:mannitol-1-phosphate 5-dehydrogenase
LKKLSNVYQVTCAVGPNILKFIAPVIAKGIDARTESKPLAVIACENAIGATTTLANFIKDEKNTPADRVASISERARFGNSAIDRIVPGQDPNAGLNVTIESFFEWVVEQKPFEPHGHPEINGVHWVDDLNPFIERKLFTVNTSHATAAYYGHNRKIPHIHEALEDPAINKQVRDALAETSTLIVKKHGIDAEEQKAYVEKIIKRISNPYLKDVVERVGRAPLRKLSRKERFVGPAAELAERGESVTALLGSIEMAFRFQNVEGDDESKELAKIVAENEPEAIVEKVCGLTKSDKLFPEVVKVVQKVKA